MNSALTYRAVVPRRQLRHAIRDVDYCVHEWGDPAARPLMLLHGWGDTGAAFQFFVDALRGDWHVIAPDWRGFGDSGHAAGAYWFPDYLADLDALLTIYSPQRPAPLLGHSMGANAAALYAGACPDRVAAFVNVEGFGLADSDPLDAPSHYRRWIESSRSRAEPRAFACYDDLVERILARSPRMERCRARYVAELWAAEDDDGRVRLKADPAHRWPNAVQYRLREAEACWTALRAPTLLVSGADSGFHTAAAAWRGHASGGRSSAPVEDLCIDDAGHMLHFEQPARLAAAVADFLHRQVPEAGL